VEHYLASSAYQLTRTPRNRLLSLARSCQRDESCEVAAADSPRRAGPLGENSRALALGIPRNVGTIGTPLSDAFFSTSSLSTQREVLLEAQRTLEVPSGDFAMKSTTFRRTKIYLGWTVHGRIVAQIAVFWIAYHVILCTALFALEYMQRLPEYLGNEPHAAAAPFLESFIHHYAWMALLPIAALPILLFDCIRLTHRIVGPLKRLESVFQQLARGEAISEVHFRDHDLMGGVEDSLNAYLATLGSASSGHDTARESQVAEILRSAGRVVVHNDPLAVELSKDQRKVAADGTVAVEVPVA
jgi:hypothetical protein